ncbi:MAG: acyl-CoA desaturase [Xanthomonadaceae bacterium]|nr:acyl-CoA desaturase [Xanthomonadaceae bacterium]
MSSSNKPQIIWPSAIFFGLVNLVAVTVIPLWGYFQGYSTAAWVVALVLLMLNGMSITTGYHRLWSHQTFKARWPVRLLLAIFGGMALQNSIYIWAARHRVHHRHVDDVERDPHSIKTGFWHAHIGWMLRSWPTSEVDFSQVPDLERDPIVMWQHKHYCEENSAVDNGLIALLTWGEGYHNYHHAFQADYRNGIRWWQYDPSKWLINTLAWTGLAYQRKKTQAFRIQRARLNVEFNRLKQRADKAQAQGSWRELFDRELQQFRETIGQWQAIQMRKVEAGTDALRDRWYRTELHTSLRELEYRLKMQRKRLRALTASLSDLTLTY